MSERDCPNCGAEETLAMSNDAWYCSSCGSAFSDAHKKLWGNDPEVDWKQTAIERYKRIQALEAKLSKMEKALGDGGDLEYAANLLQEATNDHGIDQSFDGNPYDLSDRLRKMAEALAGGDDE